MPCLIKLGLDSVRIGWIQLHYLDSTQAFEWDDWHAGPIHPLLIWNEVTPKVPGLFVITQWQAPPPRAGIVDTEYVRVVYWVDSLIARDLNADGFLSVGEYILFEFLQPGALRAQTAWYRVDEIGKSRPQDKKYILKLHCEVPQVAVACACNCHADPQCDGVTDILDVVQVINVAFRGFPAQPDPNPLCPVETTDVDCNHATDILDVSHMINVAFRGGNPATEFCNPCP